MLSQMFSAGIYAYTVQCFRTFTDEERERERRIHIEDNMRRGNMLSFVSTDDLRPLFKSPLS